MSLVVLIASLIMFGVVITTGILFYVNIYECLKVCKIENRKMSAYELWLLLIPLVNFIMWFRIAIALSKSLQLQSLELGIKEPGRPGLIPGIIIVISMILFTFTTDFREFDASSNLSESMYPLSLLALFLINMVLFWVNTSKAKRKIVKINNRNSVQTISV